jgi:hypothetical protein
VDVDQDEIRLERPRKLDRLLARDGLGDQLESGSRTDHRPGRSPKRRLVIHHDHPHR